MYLYNHSYPELDYTARYSQEKFRQYILPVTDLPAVKFYLQFHLVQHLYVHSCFFPPSEKYTIQNNGIITFMLRQTFVTNRRIIIALQIGRASCREREWSSV